MKKLLNKIVLTLLFITSFLVSFNGINIYADEKKIELEGVYKHPITGVIEDSGGEANQALGQSMVEQLLTENATYNSDSKYGSIIEFDLKMMDSISDVGFSIQKSGENSFKEVKHGQKNIDEETIRFQIPIDSTDTIIRATCFVKPMGRSVIFYIYFPNEINTQNQNNNEGDVLDKQKSNNGLIIGGPDIVDTDNNEKENNEDLSKNQNYQNYQIDESVWKSLAMLIFSVLILSGITILLIFILIKKIFFNNDNKKSNIKKEIFDFKEEEFEEMDLEFDWEDEYEN